MECQEFYTTVSFFANWGIPLWEFDDIHDYIWITVHHIQAMIYMGAGQPKFRLCELDQLLPATRDCCATDPRDRVFGILSLCEEMDDPELQPDYTTTTRDVYVRTAKWLINQGYGSKVLYDACLGTSNEYELPSWVPNWAATDIPFGRILPFANIGGKLHSCYSAAGFTLSHMIIADDDVLLVRGILFDHVSKLGAIHKYDSPKADDWVGQVRARFSLVKACTDEITAMQTADHPLSHYELRTEVPWRVLSCNSSLRHLSPDKFELNDSETYRHFTRILACCKTPNSPGNDILESASEDNLRFGDVVATRVVTYYCMDKRRGRTTRNYLGQFPLDAEEGDVVFVPAGSIIPILLRRVADKYRIIGECYVHIIMRGELVNEPSGLGLEFSDILIQ